VVQSLTYHDFKFYLTNFQKSRFAFYDADESLTKYLLIALFNISNTLTAKITGTAKLVAAFATAKWRANFAVFRVHFYC